MKPMKKLLSAYLGGISAAVFAAGLLAGCSDGQELTITLIDEAQMEECLLGEEYDFGPNIVMEDGVTYSIEVFYFDDDWEKVELETDGMKFTPPVLKDMLITVYAERGDQSEYLDYEMEVTFIADAGEENLVSAWKDTGWNATVSPDKEYVREGNSSVKFEYIGEAPVHMQIEGSSFLAMTYQTTDYIGMPPISNWYGATVSFWVYNNNSFALEFGLHTEGEPGMSGDTMTAEANAWTQITLTYSTDVGSYNYLRMRIADDEAEAADFNGLTFYFDALTFTNGTGEIPEQPAEPDAVDVAMAGSYKDDGTIALNTDAAYIKDGKTSVKYEFNTEKAWLAGATICTFYEQGIATDIENWIGATVTFWVYNASDTELEFGLHTEGERDMTGAQAVMKAAANAWTQITLTYSADAGSFNYLRVRNADGSGLFPAGTVFYIDGLAFTEGTEPAPQEPENPDAVDAAMRASYVDPGIAISLNGEAEYIREGNSSVKYVYNGTNEKYHGVTLCVFNEQGLGTDVTEWVGATVTFWVYNAGDTALEFGLHTELSPDLAGGVQYAAAGEWTQITLTYSGDPGSYNYLKVRTAAQPFTFYIDGLTFTNGTGETPEQPAEPDAVDVAMAGSYKDDGTIALNTDKAYIKDGGSSVKYEFNTEKTWLAGATICTFYEQGIATDIENWIGATVTFWVYNDSDTELEFGLHTEGERDMTGAQAVMKAAANAWTQITLTYSADAGSFNYLRVRNADGNGLFPAGTVFYIDGLAFTEGTGETPEQPAEPDAVDVAMQGSYVDSGITVSLNSEAEYIREGNSSVKYTYDGTNEKYHGITLCVMENMDGAVTEWEGATVTFWVYNAGDTTLEFGLHTELSPDLAGGVQYAAAGEWTQITLTYSGNPGSYNYLKVRTAAQPFTFYIDGLTFTNGTAE